MTKGKSESERKTKKMTKRERRTFGCSRLETWTKVRETLVTERRPFVKRDCRSKRSCDLPRRRFAENRSRSRRFLHPWNNRFPLSLTFVPFFFSLSLSLRHGRLRLRPHRARNVPRPKAEGRGRRIDVAARPEETLVVFARDGRRFGGRHRSLREHFSRSRCSVPVFFSRDSLCRSRNLFDFLRP